MRTAVPAVPPYPGGTPLSLYRAATAPTYCTDSMNPCRNILITGANGVLGNAIARLFLEQDPACRVHLGVRQGHDRVDQLVAERPDRATAHVLDVTVPGDWAKTAATLERTSAQSTVLINNAGFHDDALLATMTSTQWSAVLSANLDAVFFGCQALLPVMMRQRGGRIVNIVSLSALQPPAGQTNYAAAKAGVIALTRSLAKETARLGITVNAIAPAHIEGALPAGWTPDQEKAARLQIPMRRFARPEEVAAAVFFLASAEAGYITGATLKMDGGLA